MSGEGTPTVRSVAVLIVSWNGRKHLELLLPELEAQQPPAGVRHEVVVLDNGSYDETLEWLAAEHPWVRTVRSDVNLGFCGGNDHLARQVDADALVLLNNDTRPADGWLARLVEALAAAPADVAAVSGRIVDWQGERLDFGRGLMTFDGHAFQVGFGRRLAQADDAIPEPGEELLFACGGNMIVRREAYLRLGGFDESYFAYLEDVDLGWRLWSAGERVLAAPNAVVHHRSMATSRLLGDANRGFLFERNAFLTVAGNADDELWPRLASAVWATMVHRAQTLAVQNNPGGELLTLDPYAGLVANTASPRTLVSDGADAAESTAADLASIDTEDRVPAGIVTPAGRRRGRGRHREPEIPRTSLGEKWRGYGPRGFVRRGLRKAVRALLPRFVLEDLELSTRLVDPRTFAHQRALTWVVTHLEIVHAKRARTERLRLRPDREILARFPLGIVPTYPGDKAFFASDAFNALLPDDLVPFRRRRLDEILPELGRDEAG
ncbi:MAG: glycosyltransferase family 2 protein [Acidobacteriota bacterium]